MVQRQQCVIYVQNLAQKEYVVGSSGINENACHVRSQSKCCCLTSVISFSCNNTRLSRWKVSAHRKSGQCCDFVVKIGLSKQGNAFVFSERSKLYENEWNTYHKSLAHSQSHSKRSKGEETYKHALHSSNIKYMWGMATPSSVKRTFTRPSHPTHNSTNNDTYKKKTHLLKNSPEFWNTSALVKHLAFEVASYFGKKRAFQNDATSQRRMQPREGGPVLKVKAWENTLGMSFFFFSFLGGRNRSAAKTMAKEPYDTTIHPETMAKVVCPGSKIGSKKKKKKEQPRNRWKNKNYCTWQVFFLNTGRKYGKNGVGDMRNLQPTCQSSRSTQARCSRGCWFSEYLLKTRHWGSV